MATSFYGPRGGAVEFRPQDRGYHVAYREHEVNHCPGCGRSHWLVGRLMAECAFCATALPLESGLTMSHQSVRHTGRGAFHEQSLAA
jgi:hypothetical protein